ncbi:uncharacterized protein DUF2835 [Thiogranum longum]|uniref:Uncharacterized protein DUF2835 n=1 Tax=Thiogranum longum TaxID=1537524 RepID=A0A4R1H964_9GAMM|nr:DUF2835 family protein [Thiogranum longum]TCK18407.1 uncharacterized protein DUF2835 [Thiogranum longum]
MSRHYTYTVMLDISPEAYQRMYQGVAQNVVAVDAQGRRVQFPALSLRKFVTSEGVRGTFLIRVDANHRLVDIQRR